MLVSCGVDPPELHHTPKALPTSNPSHSPTYLLIYPPTQQQQHVGYVHCSHILVGLRTRRTSRHLKATKLTFQTNVPINSVDPQYANVSHGINYVINDYWLSGNQRLRFLPANRDDCCHLAVENVRFVPGTNDTARPARRHPTRNGPIE